MKINRIRYLRIKNDYTIQELADRIGITRQHLGQVECGKEPLSEALAVKLSSFFDVEADELYGEKVI